MTATNLDLSLFFDGPASAQLVDDLAVRILRASELEALAEVRERLLDLGDLAGKLFSVDVEGVPGGAGQLRATLQLTDAGRHLSAALGTGDVDLLVVKEALGHSDLSGASHAGDDAESPDGGSCPAAEREAGQ